jgi:hypothetical protein
MSKVDKKVRFIKAWYIKECANLDFSDRLKLARVWIEICLKDEEYEMAAAIREEKRNIVKKHIKEKRSQRSFSQRFVIFMFLLKRRISSLFKSKQSK